MVERLTDLCCSAALSLKASGGSAVFHVRFNCPLRGLSMAAQSPPSELQPPKVVPVPPLAVILLALGAATLAALLSHSPRSLSGSPGTSIEASISTPMLTVQPKIGSQVRAADVPSRLSESSVPAVVDPDDQFRALLVGTWQQDYFGARRLTVHADGTGEMVIRPNELWALAFGSELRLTMFWSISDGQIDYGIRSGTPADKVRIASQAWGDHWIEKIVDLTDDRLVLLSSDGVTESVWRRVKPETTGAKSAP